MPSNITISADKLNRLIGTPNCPSLIDVRTDDEWAAAPLLIPGAQ
jgi:rhodanese-related sulfurtransferase